MMPRDLWNPGRNMWWVDLRIRTKQTFYLASNLGSNMIQTTGAYAGQPTIFALEVQRILAAGYKQIGYFLVHPDNVGQFL